MSVTALRAPRALALDGGEPAFARPLGGVRPWFPSADAIRRALDGVLDRGWYTNHGPAARALERRIEAMLGVRHAVLVANGTIGLTMAAELHARTGPVVVPATARPAALDSLSWTGHAALRCDVDPLALGAGAAQLRAAAADAPVGGVLATRPWGLAGDAEGLLAEAARLGAPVWFDSSDALDARDAAGAPVGGAGSCEVFSFGPGRMVTATEGGCVTTNCDALAARLRNVRSSYGAGPPVRVDRTANGRMSELQAAVALLSLDDLPDNRRHLVALRAAYAAGLAGLDGLAQLDVRDGAPGRGPHHLVRLTGAGTEDALQGFLWGLRAENIVARRVLDPAPPGGATPEASLAARSVVALPVGRDIGVADAARVCDVVARLLARRDGPARHPGA